MNEQPSSTALNSRSIDTLARAQVIPPESCRAAWWIASMYPFLTTVTYRSSKRYDIAGKKYWHPIHSHRTEKGQHKSHENVWASLFFEHTLIQKLACVPYFNEDMHRNRWWYYTSSLTCITNSTWETDQTMGWCFDRIEDNISEYFDTLSRMLGLGIITFRLDWNFVLKFEFHSI